MVYSSCHLEHDSAVSSDRDEGNGTKFTTYKLQATKVNGLGLGLGQIKIV